MMVRRYYLAFYGLASFQSVLGTTSAISSIMGAHSIFAEVVWPLETVVFMWALAFSAKRIYQLENL